MDPFYTFEGADAVDFSLWRDAMLWFFKKVGEALPLVCLPSLTCLRRHAAAALCSGASSLLPSNDQSARGSCQSRRPLCPPSLHRSRCVAAAASHSSSSPQCTRHA